MPNLPELRRERADRMVAGVCGGLARHWNLDPLLLRLGMVVAAVATGGSAALGYIALWLLLPEVGDDRPLPAPIRDWSPGKLVAVVGIGVVLVSIATPGHGAVGILPVAALAWWFLHSRSASRPGPPPGHPNPPDAAHPPASPALEPPAPEPPQPLWTPPPAANRATIPVPPQRPIPPPPIPAPRPRPRVWPRVLVLCLAGWAALTCLAVAGIGVPPLAWWSVTLLALGIALVASGRHTRRPWALLPVAIVVALCTAGLLTERLSPEMPAPAGVVSYTRASAMPPNSTLPVGSHTLDLSDLEVDRSLEREVTLQMGQLTVRLPDDANVVVSSNVGLGTVQAPDGTQTTVDNADSFSSLPDPGGPTLTLNLDVNAGKVVIER